MPGIFLGPFSDSHSLEGPFFLSGIRPRRPPDLPDLPELPDAAGNSTGKFFSSMLFSPLEKNDFPGYIIGHGIFTFKEKE